MLYIKVLDNNIELNKIRRFDSILKEAEDKKQKKDPYKATKITAGINLARIPGGQAFELINQTKYFIDKNKGIYGKGLKGVGKALASKEYGIKGFGNKKQTSEIKEFLKKQKGFGLPALTALNLLPVGVAYKLDSDRLKKNKKK